MRLFNVFEYMYCVYDVILVNELKGKLFLLQVVDPVVDCHILEDILLLEGIMQQDDFLLILEEDYNRLRLSFHGFLHDVCINILANCHDVL